ncbi:ATP-grasp fold amidoligase family protein [Halobacillus sp. B29]|uniref:ATP-grasp fold amidoligase family protein n=1 Tax=Halobacillus sp. B29 TaxID=3457432 RepID=UPI003FCD9A12
MNKLRVLKKIVSNPFSIVRILGEKNLFNWLPDSLYLKLIYRAETGKQLNIKNPKTYNEKLQWLKLNARNSTYSKLVDKYEVRNYIKDTIGEEYLIPILGVYNNVEEIDWKRLPEKFVLKCTHGSSSNIICTNKSNLDIEGSKKKLRKWMKKNWYWFGREWPYKNVNPRIICEKYMVDESETELKDYKIFCFNGKPKLIQVDFNRHIHHKRNLFTVDWKLVDAKIKYDNDLSKEIPKPNRLEEMLTLAKKLSHNFPHVRVDFYSIKDKLYFGEITFYHGSGFEQFDPPNLEKKMGDWIKLDNYDEQVF